MERLEPTRSMAAKIWWSIVWKTLLGVVLSALLCGFLFGLAGRLLGIDPQSLVNLAACVGLLLGLWISFEVVYRTLKKRFTDFEIAILSRGTHE